MAIPHHFVFSSVVASSILLCALMCQTVAAQSETRIRQPERPEILVHSETALRPCLRIYQGVKAVATVSSLYTKSGHHTVSYSLVISGTASPPSSALLLLGDPCNPLASPSRLLSLSQGVWEPWAYQGQPAWRLQGAVASSLLQQAVLTNGKAVKGRLGDVHVAFVGNQTLAGRIQLVGVTAGATL